MSGPTMQLLKKKKQTDETLSDDVFAAIDKELGGTEVDTDVPAKTEAVEQENDPVAEEKVENTKKKAATKPKAKSKAKPISGDKEVAVVPSFAPNPEMVMTKTVMEETVHAIETLKDEDAAHQMARSFYESSNYCMFALGGVLSKIQSEGWVADHEDFKAYLEKEFGFKYRKAIYHINIYNTLNSLDLPYAAFEGLGWKKAGMIMPHLLPENYEDWIETAMSMTVNELQAYLKALNTNQDPDEAKEQVSSLVTKTFKLHEDQKETLDDALEMAKEQGNTEHDSVALEYICSNYIGGTATPKKEKLDYATFMASVVESAIEDNDGARSDALVDILSPIAELFEEFDITFEAKAE